MLNQKSFMRGCGIPALGIAALMGLAIAGTGCIMPDAEEDTGGCANGKCDQAYEDKKFDVLEELGLKQPGVFPDGPQFKRFRGYTHAATLENKPGIRPILGYLPPNKARFRGEDHLEHYYGNLTDVQRNGMAAWMLFSSDGRFLREVEKGGVNAKLGISHLLQVIDTRDAKQMRLPPEMGGTPREQRFARYGLLNDPNCVESKEPDEFGLFLDKCAPNRAKSYPGDPYSTGIISFRLKPNPNFDMAAWKKYMKNGVFQFTQESLAVEPPYLPSLTCGTCHASPSPVFPPKDINHPQWDNVVFGLGNQFFREGALFGYFSDKGSFTHQLLNSQRPGTSDTSRIDSDYLNNPNIINSISHLSLRPIYIEKIDRAQGLFNPETDKRLSCPSADDYYQIGQPIPSINDARLQAQLKARHSDTGECVLTYHILKDGADSSGPIGALARVYVNIGSCVPYFLRGVGGKVLTGQAQQSPIDRKGLHEKCKEYQSITGLLYGNGSHDLKNTRVPEVYDFLASIKPYKLADALSAAGRPNNADLDQVDRGKKLFAMACMTCHSSIQPHQPQHDDPGAVVKPVEPGVHNVFDMRTWYTPERQAFFLKLVQDPNFPDNNFLSDDRRYPLSVLQTNAKRALGTNAIAGHLWAPYASQTYKDLPAVTDALITLPGITSLFPHVTLKVPFLPGGGRGYYRPASLYNIWNSAPFLHNNGLGKFNEDGWTLDSRLDAFDDAIQQLLGLKERAGGKSILRTDRFTTQAMPITFKDPLGISHTLTVHLPIPADAPIDLVANLGLVLNGEGTQAKHLRDVFVKAFEDALKQNAFALVHVLAQRKDEAPGVGGFGGAVIQNFINTVKDEVGRAGGDELLLNAVLGADSVADKGHYFTGYLHEGGNLKAMSPDEKKDLIQFLKTI
jgi:cytochrome c5